MSSDPCHLSIFLVWSEPGLAPIFLENHTTTTKSVPMLVLFLGFGYVQF